MAQLAIRCHATRGNEVIELGLTVKELKEILDKYPPQAHVRIFGRCINVNDIAFEMPSINEHSEEYSIEVWKDIKGYEDRYQISNHGRVKSKARLEPHSDGKVSHIKEKLMTLQCKKGYYQVNITDGVKVRTKLVHRLVAEAFIENPFGYNVIDHIDGNPSNNMVNNLRWVTQRINCNTFVSRSRRRESKKKKTAL